MKRTLFEKMGDFVLGKGFYIVLFLCVATIGISGYYLVRAAAADPAGELEPAAANPIVELPEESAPVQKVQPAVPETVVKKPETAAPSVPKKETKQPAAAQPSQTAPTETAPKPKAPPVFTRPVKGKVLRGHSVETLAYDRTMGDWRTHSGVDLAAEAGLKVLCASDGTVAAVKKDDLMGLTVVVDHGEGLQSVYSNLADPALVSAGQAVQTGSVLGTVGNTAIAESSMESHLHLEMTKDGQAVDPLTYLPK